MSIDIIAIDDPEDEDDLDEENVEELDDDLDEDYPEDENDSWRDEEDKTSLAKDVSFL